jgi:raffinose/stachyose/melibiose transport system permease protein
MKKTIQPISRVFLYFLLIVWLVVSIYPIFWVALTSFRTNADVITNPWGFPKSFLWGNYLNAIEKSNIPRYFLNSMVVSCSSVALILLVSSMAAFTFARLKFKFRDPLFYITLLGLGIPPQIALVPLFILNLKLGISNTYLALIGPNVAFNLPFGIMILRAFMLTIPHELEEAAFLDGCSRFRMFWEIFFPLSMPALSVVGVFTFVGTWNEYLFALSFISDEKFKTLTVGLSDFIGEFVTQWPLMAAGMVISTVPMILIYIFMQDKLTKAMTVGAVK